MAIEEQTQVSSSYAINYHNDGRAGQRLTISDRKVTKLAFWIRKRGSPTGNVTMCIRRVSDDGIILSKVWGAAIALSTDYSFVEVEFETPVTINEEVRLSCEADVQPYGDDVFYMYQNTDVKADECHSRYLTGAWSDQGGEDCAYRYTYLFLSVTIQPMTDILVPSAKAHGTVASLGATPCTQHGHCWSTSPNPTTADNKTELGAVASAPHTFESTLTDLLKDTTYYVRAYATDGSGTLYNAEVSFTTTWRDEKALPFAPTGQIFFSPIIGGEVYVIDQGYHFYKYNLATRSWTELISPNYGSDVDSRSRFFRTLAISPDGTKLACCSEGKWSTYIGSEDYKTGGGRRVEIYNIAGNSWSASKQTDFSLDGQWAATRSLVWEDEDTLWVWCIAHKRSASGWTIKCVKYTISTDTWTPFTSSFLDTATGVNGLNCGNGGSAIKADKSVVYGGGNALADYTCKKYTIETDAYSGISLDPLTNRFCHIYDRDKIWYYEAGGTYQQGYIDVADDSLHDDILPENPDLDTSGKHGGIADDLSIIIIHAKSAAPRLMAFTLIVTPTGTTNPATELRAKAATLNGTLDADGGEACDCGFEWGPDTSYDYFTSTRSKTTGQTFSEVISGLEPGTTYHFRAFATNSAGTSYGADRTFSTVLAMSRAFALSREEL